MSFILGIVFLTIFEAFLVGSQKYSGVLRVDITSCNFLKLCVNCSSFLVDPLLFPTHRVISSTKRDDFASFKCRWSFSYLIAFSRNSRRILNIVVKASIFVLFLILGVNHAVFSWLSMILAVIFFINGLHCVEDIHLYSYSVECFYHEKLSYQVPSAHQMKWFCDFFFPFGMLMWNDISSY
jgi:hypothetical protein